MLKRQGLGVVQASATEHKQKKCLKMIFLLEKNNKESLYLYIFEGLPKSNLFGYWLIQSYLPSYSFMLCQLLPVSGIHAFKDILKHKK